MRFVPVKSAARQAALVHHRVCTLLVRPRTMSINARRGCFAEFAVIAPVRRHRVVDLSNLLQDAGDDDTPTVAREAYVASSPSCRLSSSALKCSRPMREGRTLSASIDDSIGPITPSAIAATVGSRLRRSLTAAARGSGGGLRQELR